MQTINVSLTPRGAAKSKSLNNATKEYIDSKIANIKMVAIWG